MTIPFPAVQLDVVDFGSVKMTTVNLSPLHALIGPNDSGKSTLLEAIQSLTTQATSARITPLKTLLQIKFESGAMWRFDGNVFSDSVDKQNRVPIVRPARKLRFEPGALREAGPLIPDGHPISFADPSGRGLPGMYDALISRNVSQFMAIQDQFLKLFPTVKSLQFYNPSNSTKAFRILLKDSGKLIDASAMSEGMLYFLAYAVLPYLEPTSFLLVEEPENGLHPARISEVVRILREVSKTTHVLVATHSPTLINELTPDEVSVVRRTVETGTTAVAIKKTPNFDERIKAFGLGDLWASYSDGDQEAPLFTARKSKA